MSKQGEYRTMESWLMSNGKSGYTFYSAKMDKHLTAIAAHKGRKITTERTIALTMKNLIPVAVPITKVTLL